MSAQETTLGANQLLSDNHRLHFATNGTVDTFSYLSYYVDFEANYLTEGVQENKVRRHAVFEADDGTLQIALTPGQIRSFIIEIKKN